MTDTAVKLAEKTFKKLFPFIAGFVLVCIFFRNNIFNHAVNVTPYVGTNDFMDLSIPFRSFLIDSLKKGTLPFWAPNVSSGYPLLAEGQVAALNPVNLILSSLTLLDSVSLTMLVNYFLLYLFSYLYFRKINLSLLASIFGGVAVTFSGFSINQIQHWDIFTAFYLFVAQLYLLETFLRSKKLHLLFLLGIFFGLSILGGHKQIVLYSGIFIGLYWLFFWYRKRYSFLKLFFFMTVYAVIGLGIGAGQLLPQYEFTQVSTRKEGVNLISQSKYHFDFTDLATFVSPFFTYADERSPDVFVQNGWPRDEMYVYPGLIVVFLALSSFLLKKRNIYFYISWLTVIGSIVFAFGTALPTGYILRLPPFNFFRLPFRITFLTNFALSYLAAYSLQNIYDKYKGRVKDRKLLIFSLAALISVFIVDTRVNAKKLYPEVDGDKWYEAPEVVEYLKNNLDDQERVTVEPYFPPDIKIRFLEDPGLWKDFEIHNNLRNTLPIFTNLIYGIPENVGIANSGGLKIKRYNDLEMEIFIGGYRYDAEGNLGVTDEFLFLNRLMGVRYILSTQPIDTFITKAVKEISFEGGDEKVYVNEFIDYYPRQFMVPRASKLTPDEIKETLVGGQFEPKQEILVEQDTDWGAKGGYSTSSQFVSYEDTKIVIKTQASGDGFLFLSDTYYPGWEAYVCETGRSVECQVQNANCRRQMGCEETEILRANYAFRAVRVPEGEHEVVFVYRPQSFKLGITITLVTSAVSLLAVGFFILSKKGRLDFNRDRKVSDSFFSGLLSVFKGKNKGHSVPTVIAFTLLTLFSLRGVYGDDIWFHLATGRYIFLNQSIPKTDVFSHTAFGLSWVNQNWLSDTLFFLVEDSLGFVGLGLFFTVITLSIFIVFYKLLSKLSDNKLFNLLITLLVSYFSIARFQARPETGSYLFIVILIYFLMEEQPVKRYVYIPLAFLLWSNWQAGFVPFGLLIFLAYLFGKTVVEVVKNKTQWLKALKRSDIALFVLSASASLINPLGFGGLIYFFKVRPGYLTADFTEWGSVARIISQSAGDRDFRFLLTGYIFFLILFSSVSVLFFYKQKGTIDIRKYLEKRTWLLLLIPFIFAPFYAYRFIPLSIFVMAIMSVYLLESLKGFSVEKFLENTKLRKTILLAVAGLSLIRLLNYKPALTNADSITPIRNEIISFIRENDLVGSIFNPLEDGGYFIWEMPERKVFIDERLDVYTASGIYDDYTNVYAFPPGEDWKAVLDKYGVELVILPGWQEEPMKTIYESGEFSLVYWSDYFFLLVKKDGLNRDYVDKNEVTVFLPFRKDEYNKEILDRAIAEALMLSAKSPKSASPLTSIGGLYMQKKDYGRAIDYLEKSLEINPNDLNVELNLGAVYSDLGDCRKAVEHFEKATKSENKAFRALVLRHLGFTYLYCLNDTDSAYKYLRQFISAGKKAGVGREYLLEAEEVTRSIINDNILRDKYGR